EVRDRSDVLALRQADDPQDQRPAEREHQNGPDVDRNKVISGGSGEADAAEEGPGGAVDGERQSVDEGTAVSAFTRANGSVARPGNGEQHADIGDAKRQDGPTVEH